MRDYGKKEPGHKVSKEQCDYRKGTPHKHCGVCSMFRPPNGCTLVKGDIQSTGLCKYFDRK